MNNKRVIKRRPVRKPVVKIKKASSDEVFDFKRDSEKSDLVYYCRSCEKIVDYSQLKQVTLRRKLKFRCSECKKEEIVYGPGVSVVNYFKIKGTGIDTTKS